MTINYLQIENNKLMFFLLIRILGCVTCNIVHYLLSFLLIRVLRLGTCNIVHYLLSSLLIRIVGRVDCNIVHYLISSNVLLIFLGGCRLSDCCMNLSSTSSFVSSRTSLSKAAHSICPTFLFNTDFSMFFFMLTSSLIKVYPTCHLLIDCSVS
nr:MAG TPA: hypothetical protein [Caudoviricetes sp.]